MPSVTIKSNEYFEAALRRFKRACEKSGIYATIRAKKFYEKPTAVRKRKKAAAVKRHQKNLQRTQAMFEKQPRFGYIAAEAELASRQSKVES